MPEADLCFEKYVSHVRFEHVWNASLRLLVVEMQMILFLDWYERICFACG